MVQDVGLGTSGASKLECKHLKAVVTEAGSIKLNSLDSRLCNEVKAE